ncbi:MAG: Asp23/Gls24 family envelope stress response protein [Anaerolineales bacterium]|nr:Asp23/Gls24 family envelope stress response protein [Anaerolineales bacterium]MDW8226681.1 Asp23/Gls24 family envelope stress response protein [Anaerolineales bacterium]
MSEYRSAGKTTISHEVLLTIARQAALEVEGVQRMAPVKGTVRDLFDHRSDGVRINIEDGLVFVDLFLVLKHDVNVRDVGRQVQTAVARAISEMTGLETGHVNIHIEDIEYPSEA